MINIEKYMKDLSDLNYTDNSEKDILYSNGNLKYEKDKLEDALEFRRLILKLSNSILHLEELV